jgi:integrase
VGVQKFHRKFKQRAAIAGVPDVPVHSTRRTCASLRLSWTFAMQIMRHSQIAVIELPRHVLLWKEQLDLSMIGAWLCKANELSPVPQLVAGVAVRAALG